MAPATLDPWHPDIFGYPDPWRNGFMESLNTWRFGGDWDNPNHPLTFGEPGSHPGDFFLSNNKNLCNRAGQQMLVPVSLKRCFLAEWEKRETTNRCKNDSFFCDYIHEVHVFFSVFP